MLNFGNKEFRNLQEQVLKNAQDIEILKNRPQMRVAVVDVLPLVGDPTVIYLVPSDEGIEPNVYEEYVWLEDEERYEMIGTTAIDLSNMVTTDTDQTITGDKIFTGDTTVANLTSEGDIETEGKVIIGATGYDIKKDGSNLVIEADGNAVKVRGDLIPNTGSTYTLGNASAPWKTIFLSHYVDFGNNAIIQKDSSNRLNFNNGGNTIIKVGGYGNTNRTYIANNLVPDTDDLNLNLGASNMRWSVGYINSIENDYGALQLRARAAANPWITLDTNNTNEVGGIAPASDQSAKLGNSGKKFLTTYTRYINDDNVNIAVSDVATKADPMSPPVTLSGTFDANGEFLINFDADNVFQGGMYMISYSYAQAIIYLNPLLLLGARTSGSPCRAACPVIYDSQNHYAVPGNVRVELTSYSVDLEGNYTIEQIRVKISDGNLNAAQGLTCSLMKTGLAK